MEFDLSQAWETVQHLADGFMAMLPRLVLALVLFAAFYVIGRGVRAAVRAGASRRRQPPTLALALGRLTQAVILLVGVLIAVTAAFPTFTPRDLITTLGIGGVAIGFAFKDIFENFLAGVLILLNKPFVVGDQIVHGQYEGTVEEIQTRATYLRTYDGRRVIIPNGELFTNSVTVNTAFPRRRMQYDIGIGYGDDLEQARRIVLEVMQQTEGVAPDPKADVIVVNFAESSVSLRARWWSDSGIADVLIAQDRVLTEVKRRLTEAGIDLPYPTRQVLFHDQTEETDGDRARQREGWPAGRAPVPRPRGIAAMLARVSDRESARVVPRDA